MPAFESLIIDPNTLHTALVAVDDDIHILDVRAREDYESGHIDAAQHLDPSALNRSEPPIGGLLPSADEVGRWTRQLGLSQDSTIVVYDGGRSTTAARALWVLHTYGFGSVHWLNGGLPAWVADGHPITREAAPVPIAAPAAELSADASMVLTNQDLITSFTSPTETQPARQAIDARSLAEFTGEDVRSNRGGHMPSAVHYEWLEFFADDGRLKPMDQLQQAISERQLNPQEPCVVYCQTHQRSAVTYVVLKHLGFTDVAALDGAWSNWGNDPNTPIER